MRKGKKKVINWILNILIIILIIVGIYLFVTRILGHSPTDFQLILWLFGFLVAVILKISALIYGLNREIGEIKANIKSSFNKIRIDLKEIKLKIMKDE